MFIDAGFTGESFLNMESCFLSLRALEFTSSEAVRITDFLKSLVKCYEVRATYKKAKSIKGVRAKLYEEADLRHAIYSVLPSKSIWYTGDDLHLNLLFEDKTNALAFTSFLRLWHINNSIVVSVDAVSVNKEVYIYESELKYVALEDYDGEESVGSLEQYKSSYSSTSELIGASMDSHFAQLQSIEKLEEFKLIHVNPYRCHIKGQKSFPQLKDNDNNMLALSWLLHQFFDGLNLVDEPSGQIKVPQIAIRCNSDHFTEELVGTPVVKRKKVSLTIECRTVAIFEAVGARIKLGSERVSDLEWKTFVYVENPYVFCDCLEWKFAETKETWKKADCDIEMFQC